MRKSARLLGKEYGLNAQEMNYILKNQGLLDGEPGDYWPTEKGAAYAFEKYEKRGTGGYKQYNPEWTTRSWDESVLDILDMSPEAVAEARQGLADYRKPMRDATLATPKDSICVQPAGMGDNITPDMLDKVNWSNVAKGAGAAIVVAAGTYAIYKAAPYVKKWWQNKAYPAIRARFARDSA